MRYIKQTDEMESQHVQNMKNIVNFDEMLTVLNNYECPEGCAECCDNVGIVQFYTKKKFEAFKKVTEGINVDTITDTIQIGQGIDAFKTDVYGLVAPCNLITSKGRCNLDEEYLPIVCQMRPFVLENDFANGVVSLHICDKGLRIYDDIIDFLMFQNKRKNLPTDALERQIVGLRKEYEEKKGTGIHIVIKLNPEIFPALLIYDTIKDMMEKQ